MFHTILMTTIGLATLADSTDQSSTQIRSDSLKEDIVVSAVRANILTPITQTNITKKEILERYVGFDIPYFIQNTPSIVSRSDAGNFIGYSDFRLRGMDDKRISFSINGIPINDAETQGFYTNNFADLASSAQSIQIQRGIGTTSNGTAPLAGSVNVLTNDLRGPASFGLTTGYGSFNSSRLVAEYSTGLLHNKVAFYGRISGINSDGYRRNSGSDLKTYFVSGAYFGKRSMLKFNAFGGITRSQLAYIGLDKATLAADRTTNFMQPTEKDEFQQHFFQVQYSYTISERLNFSTSAYYVKGNAPYFQLLWPGFGYSFANMPNAIVGKDTIQSTTMMPSYRLNQEFGGAMAFLTYKSEKSQITAGLHANHFKSDHFMEINWAQVWPSDIQLGHQAYFNTGYKNELSSFVKAQYFVKPWLMAFADVQVRTTSWRYQAKDKAIFRDTFRVQQMQWLFFNPKVGLRINLSNQISLYGTAGTTSREPTRTDYLLDDRANFNVRQDLVRPENVFNAEFGTEMRTQNLFFAANIYLMEFQNEILQTGEINAYGASIRKNVSGGSYRRGLELSANYQINKILSIYNNSAISTNQIARFDQTYKINDAAQNYAGENVVVSYRNVSPLLTPNAVLNQGIRISPTEWLVLDVSARYVSSMYLDNTNNENAKLPDYSLLDARAAIKLGQLLKLPGDHTLSFQLNNITNTLYSPAGNTSVSATRNVLGETVVQTNPSYFPAATRNFFLTLSIKL